MNNDHIFMQTIMSNLSEKFIRENIEHMDDETIDRLMSIGNEEFNKHVEFVKSTKDSKG